jgi:hypothetical protein
MESHDVDLEAQRSLAPFVEERETDHGDVANGMDQCERHSQQSMGTNACGTARNVRSGEEDKTQLAAIRELMQRASARGVWLTLGEIAEVTEFAEASISAQLRHLRKPHHSGHRVEKRRRSPLGAAPVARARRPAKGAGDLGISSMRFEPATSSRRAPSGRRANTSGSTAWPTQAAASNSRTCA